MLSSSTGQEKSSLQISLIGTKLAWSDHNNVPQIPNERFCNPPPGGRVYLVTQRRNWTLWKFGSTQVAENFSVGIFCQAGKNLHASLRNWPPEGRVYLVTLMRKCTLWEFGSTYVNENLSVGIFCQAGKKWHILIMKLATRGPSLFCNSNEKLDIVGVWVHPGCWEFVCRHISSRGKKLHSSLWNWPTGGQVFSKINEKLDIMGVWVHPWCWKFVCRQIGIFCQGGKMACFIVTMATRRPCLHSYLFVIH